MIRVFLFLFFLFFLSSCAAERTIVLPDAASKAYGFVWFHDDASRSLAVGSSGTYVPINFSDGCVSSNMGCSSWNVSVERAGDYVVDFHSSFSDGGNNEFHLSVGVDGVFDHRCHTARKLGNSGDVGSMSGGCLLSLSVGDVVSLLVENADTANSIDIKDFAFSMVKV